LVQLANYSLVKFDADLGAPSVFKGNPRKELDDAWRGLVDRESAEWFANARLF
jgi:hypothetical protein